MWGNNDTIDRVYYFNKKNAIIEEHYSVNVSYFGNIA